MWLPHNISRAIDNRPYRSQACAEAMLMQKAHRLCALKFSTLPAVHEAGHAIVAWQSRHVSSVTSITCGVDRGITEAGRINATQATPPSIWEWLAVDLAGLAAELLVFKKFNSIQSSDDLTEARNDAVMIVRMNSDQQWADDTRLGSLAFEKMFSSNHPPTEPVVQVMNKAYRRAKALILCEQDRFARLTLELHKKGAMNLHDIKQVLGTRFPKDILP